MALLGCGGGGDGDATTAAEHGLSADQRDEIEALLQETQTGGDPVHCTRDYTDNLVAKAGGLEKCRQIERSGGEPDQIEIISVQGSDNGTATAVMIAHGGNFDGYRSTADLVFEDGRWKLDDFHLIQQPAA